MLSGVICDDDGQPYSFDACVACARRGGPRRCHNPLPLIRAMSKNAEERRDAGISATMLLDCPRKVIIMGEEPYYEKPSAYWARFRGTIGHLMMEEYGSDIEGVFQEIRFRKVVPVEIDGQVVDVEITGKPDWVDKLRKMILDFKSIKSINTKPIKDGKPKENHEPQVNIYRWLTWGGQPHQGYDEQGNAIWGEPEFHEIERGGILYFDMSGTRKVAVNIWPIEQTEAYIVERLLPLAKYRANGELPPFWQNEKGNRHILCNYCAVRDLCDKRGV